MSLDDELLKLCQYKIKGICYDEGKSKWYGENKEKYEKLGFENCRHLINEKYLPAYHLFEDGKRVAIYHPRYSNARVYGNKFVNMNKTESVFSDNTEDFKDTTAVLYVWHIVKAFENETKLRNNIRHYRLGKWETQLLFMDFPGEAG